MTNKIGKYKILSEIGRGGMGVVYKAEDPLLEEARALKVVHPELLRDDEFRERFISEAKMLNKLMHKNIVRFYEVGEDAESMFIVTELLEGTPLDELLKEVGTFDGELALKILQGSAEGLSFAHSKNVLHRDIKPGNIFITQENGLTAKLLDFGLAKSMGEKSMTTAGMAVGTPQYIAPEILNGAKAGPSSDIYALGIIAFKMVTGKMPIDLPEDQSSVMAITLAIYKAHQAGMPKVRSVNPNADENLANIIDKMLETDVKKRFSNGNELVEALTGQLTPSPSSSSASELQPDKLSQSEGGTDFDKTTLGMPVFGEMENPNPQPRNKTVGANGIRPQDDRPKEDFDKTTLGMPVFGANTTVPRNKTVGAKGGSRAESKDIRPQDNRPKPDNTSKKSVVGEWIVVVIVMVLLIGAIFGFAKYQESVEKERIAEETRIAEEARAAEEATIVEEARIAEEARIVEDARVAEEAKAAEEKKVAAKKRRVARKRNKFPNRWIGLRWSKVANSEMNWNKATRYCKKLGGRLPTKSELKRLYDSGSAPSHHWFWSSTANTSRTDYAWGMHFSGGNVDDYSKTNRLNVRCVRGGGD